MITRPRPRIGAEAFRIKDLLCGGQDLVDCYEACVRRVSVAAQLHSVYLRNFFDRWFIRGRNSVYIAVPSICDFS
ncbi:hypothetical protein [Mycobacterium bohemicum]|uniref:hypothetical protein n=1 Tax=Mycobacterium bohemicum TaxID=56425 RepID=UPI001112C2CA|nr:hypothetical protein [Mycobacterium bohemicum]